MKAFDKIASYIDWAKNSDTAKVIAGGSYDKSKDILFNQQLS
jgi:hypothetical protein